MAAEDHGAMGVLVAQRPGTDIRWENGACVVGTRPPRKSGPSADGKKGGSTSVVLVPRPETTKPAETPHRKSSGRCR